MCVILWKARWIYFSYTWRRISSKFLMRQACVFVCFFYLRQALVYHYDKHWCVFSFSELVSAWCSRRSPAGEAFPQSPGERAHQGCYFLSEGPLKVEKSPRDRAHPKPDVSGGASWNIWQPCFPRLCSSRFQNSSEGGKLQALWRAPGPPAGPAWGHLGFPPSSEGSAAAASPKRPWSPPQAPRGPRQGRATGI